MKEVTFIRRNIEKWKETEKVVERAASLSPDQLADAYTDLTADLAFAQTHFPTSRLSSKYHTSLSGNTLLPHFAGHTPKVVTLSLSFLTN